MRKNTTQSMGRSALLAAAVLVWSTTASASTLILSDFSSDETDAAVLDATLDFSNLLPGDEIELTVTNDTTDPFEYFINEIFFNVTDDVTGLTLTDVSTGLAGWDLIPGVGQGPFGTFDFQLKDGVGNSPDQVAPGESVVFTFLVEGDLANVDMTDFVSEFSTLPPGDTPALAAAKFVRGPGDDSAFGAVVPEPGTLSLLAMGVLGLAAATRRRR